MIYRKARIRFVSDWSANKWKSSEWWLRERRKSTRCIWSRRSMCPRRAILRRPLARRQLSRLTPPVCNHTTRRLDSVLPRKLEVYIDNCRFLRPTGALTGRWWHIRVWARRIPLCIGTDNYRGLSLCCNGNFWLNTCICRVHGVLQFHTRNTSDPPKSNWFQQRCQP